MSGVMHHSSRYSHDEESSCEQAELALLGVLLERIHKLIFGDFQLGICATRNLNHHVEYILFGICKQRNIMEWRDNLLGNSVFNINPVF